jgi:hypothetical protein
MQLSVTVHQEEALLSLTCTSGDSGYIVTASNVQMSLPQHRKRSYQHTFGHLNSRKDYDFEAFIHRSGFTRVITDIAAKILFDLLRKCKLHALLCVILEVRPIAKIACDYLIPDSCPDLEPVDYTTTKTLGNLLAVWTTLVRSRNDVWACSIDDGQDIMLNGNDKVPLSVTFLLTGLS